MTHWEVSAMSVDMQRMRASASAWRSFAGLVGALGLVGAGLIAKDAATVEGVLGEEIEPLIFFGVLIGYAVPVLIVVGVLFLLTRLLDGLTIISMQLASTPASERRSTETPHHPGVPSGTKAEDDEPTPAVETAEAVGPGTREVAEGPEVPENCPGCGGFATFDGATCSWCGYGTPHHGQDDLAQEAATDVIPEHCPGCGGAGTFDGSTCSWCEYEAPTGDRDN
jgi:hypothetical protein